MRIFSRSKSCIRQGPSVVGNCTYYFLSGSYSDRNCSLSLPPWTMDKTLGNISSSSSIPDCSSRANYMAIALFSISSSSSSTRTNCAACRACRAITASRCDRPRVGDEIEANHANSRQRLGGGALRCSK